MPFYLVAKYDPQVHQCTLQLDRLTVNNKQYKSNSTDNLPFDLPLARSNHRVFNDNNTVAFFGGQSFLSNFHPCTIKHEDKIFNSSEQLFQYKKAQFFKDKTTSDAILKATNPKHIKALSYQINGYHQQSWIEVAPSIMETTCTLKFSQNEELKTPENNRQYY